MEFKELAADIQEEVLVKAEEYGIEFNVVEPTIFDYIDLCYKIEERLSNIEVMSGTCAAGVIWARAAIALLQEISKA